MADLSSIAQHSDRVLALARPKVCRNVPLDRAYGHVLAGDARAILANPIFDNSAMDGFALHGADVAGSGPWVLPVAGDIPAGALRITCPPGHAVRVMTGAPVPPGEDILVVPVEQTDVPAGPQALPEQITVRTVDLNRSHIRPAGGKHAAGVVVAATGTRVDAGTLAALTSAGVQAVDVYARPTVAVISTGDELVPWPDVPGASQLPDSNLPMIAELAAENGAAEVRRFHSGDRGKGLAELLDEASVCDVIVTTGGISAGAFDVVREVVAPRQGSWFGPVAQRPGTPQGVASWGEATLVCLPGTPWRLMCLFCSMWPRCSRCWARVTGPPRRFGQSGRSPDLDSPPRERATHWSFPSAYPTRTVPRSRCRFPRARIIPATSPR